MQKIRTALNLVSNNKGQQTVEFLLMLGAVVSFALAFIVTFHKEIAGGFFSIIGNILR